MLVLFQLFRVSATRPEKVTQSRFPLKRFQQFEHYDIKTGCLWIILQEKLRGQS